MIIKGGTANQLSLSGGAARGMRIIINPTRKPTIENLKKTYDDGHALTLNDYDKLANKIEKLNDNRIKTKEPLLWRMYYGLDYFVDCLETAADQGNLIGWFLDWVFYVVPGRGTNSRGPG